MDVVLCILLWISLILLIKKIILASQHFARFLATTTQTSTRGSSKQLYLLILIYDIILSTKFLQIILAPDFEF